MMVRAVGLRFATFLVEPFQLGGQLGGACRGARGEQFDDFGGYVHAAGGVDARSQAKGHVEAGKRLGGRIEGRGGKQGAQTGADGVAQLPQAECCNDAVLPLQRHGVGDGGDGGHFEEAGQGFSARAGPVAALQHRLRQFHCNGGAAEEFFRVGAIRLVGVENGQRRGNLVAGFQQVVVGNNQVQAQTSRGFRLGKGPHAGVHGNHEADAIGVSGFEHA